MLQKWLLDVICSTMYIISHVVQGHKNPSVCTLVTVLIIFTKYIHFNRVGGVTYPKEVVVLQPRPIRPTCTSRLLTGHARHPRVTNM